MNNNCWREIGVWGDRTCTKLESEIHCRNCALYSQAGRGFLERTEPDGYTAEWLALLRQTRQQTKAHNQSVNGQQTVTIFRLGQEWLALPADIFDQVGTPRPVHALPHQRSQLLRGIVNVRGQLLPCVSIHKLLGIDTANRIIGDRVTAAWQPTPISQQTEVSQHLIPTISKPSTTTTQAGNQTTAYQRSREHKRYSRLVVIQQAQVPWAFEVDELAGLYACSFDQLRHAPSASSQCLETLTQSVFSWKNHQVSYLDAERLFLALQQQAL